MIPNRKDMSVNPSYSFGITKRTVAARVYGHNLPPRVCPPFPRLHKLWLDRPCPSRYRTEEIRNQPINAKEHTVSQHATDIMDFFAFTQTSFGIIDLYRSAPWFASFGYSHATVTGLG